MKYTVDRIENNIAVCEKEDGSFVEFKTELLYDGIKEGDIFSFDNDDKAVFLKEDTNRVREFIIKLQNDLFES